MVDKELYVGLIDMTKCSDEQKENLGWLALAMHLSGKECPICGQAWNCREDVKRTNPKCGYNQEAVCSPCWDEYMVKYGKDTTSK